MGVNWMHRIVCFALFLLPLEAAASVRHALLIGNSRYEVATPLRNPENDIEIVGAALEKSGFAVTKVANAKASDTLAAIEAFVKRLAVAENPVVMVYFAGHGVQLAGENYLLPVDAKLGSEEELRSVALSLGELTRRLDAVKSSLQIVVLDSCRNNPFEQTRGLRRGLATAPERLGRIVAYSTSPGNVATDGDTGASPYATALAESVTIPGLSIEGVFKRVRATVQERTGGKQEPWENSAVYGDFQFVEGKSAEAGGDEVAFFEFAALADSQEAYQKYLSRYPEGMFASLARQKITFMDKDFSFRRQNETFRHFTFSTAGDDACGMGSFKAEQQTGDDIADGEIILLDLFFLYPDAPCKNTVFFDSLVDVDGSGFSKNRIHFDYFGSKFYRTAANVPFDPAPYTHFMERFDELIFAYRNMHKDGEILLEVLEPQKLTADYVTIDSCEGTCFGLQALVRARVTTAEETRTYAFEVVSAAELGLTWKYQNTVSKLRETTATVSDGASAQPASLAFLETRTIAGWQVVAAVDPNRNLESCEASRIQDGGRRSVFRLYPYDLLTIGFTDPKRNFEEISGRPFTYRVDQSEMPFITRTQSGDEIAYQIEPTTKVIEALKAGAEINLHDGMLSLTGSRAMLSELQRCIAAFGG
ncbi:caspase family protein [Ensifer sp. ENS01]|uniref:caspase family protein n=1 Tax=Ensifer TaxID=106591 RepID=UPI000DD4FE1E|nr:caspase family protein [Ensifer sp. ENS01]MBD9496411.1 caspase family protein [Ensifer sp. ENS01]